MPSKMREQREIDTTASPAFTRFYFRAIGVAALIGLIIGLIWVVAGLLNFHVLR
jgi:hypothetical protein